MAYRLPIGQPCFREGLVFNKLKMLFKKLKLKIVSTSCIENLLKEDLSTLLKMSFCFEIDLN